MTKFSDLNLDAKVLKAIEEAGYETPTPIQAGAIPAALDGRDVLGIAQTGTGKTASFTLPMINMLGRGRARARMPRSLVLAPTRELAAQVAENFDTYAKYTKLTKALLIGGVSFKEQDALIDKGVDVLIATPGRLLDHFERGKLLLTGVQVMVVDEADRMLDMGFIPDIERIFSLTPFTRQTLFFSATMAPEIERITNTFLSNPEKIEVARQATASETITQGVVMFRASRKDRSASEKRKVLRALIDAEGDACSNAIIFCNRKVDVDVVAKSLTKNGYDAAPIHGDLEQSQRTRTLEGFREGKLRFLVASDVAARGLDVPAVSHVFNFDVPGHAEDYVHRIGRTGRAGRDGKAIMICSTSDEKNLEDVERLIEKEIPRIDNPLGQSAAADPEAPARPAEESPESGEQPKRTRSRRKPKDSASSARSGEAPSETAPVDAPGAPAETPPATETAQGVQDDAAPKAPARETAEAAPEPAPAAQADEAPEQKRPARGKGSRSDRGRDKSQGQQSGNEQPRQGRNDRQRGGEVVVGMGDHLPSFIAKSFEERQAS
ncbi:DEAD/DEAH box helicase [Profundibacterium mesophilum]|uniref:DEAD-box ATP-dependent RNA helicase RhpA n=1 Tax=Profundibacterium mesophilum KAUST100406-0324 TaxID=1037889 RepID=A0A921TDY7_9RHOB|nr:DEAD/DEAH box helicase [Profundibacterium mesophilum]KAF0674849.1 ATP-dependent helicase DEAD-box [Profundibacterium mesophilum KAUST100406-0324]